MSDATEPAGGAVLEPWTAQRVAFLSTAYTAHADGGRVSQLAGLFLADGVLEVNGVSYAGPAAALEFFTRVKAAVTASDVLPARHHVASLHAQARAAGLVTVSSCFQFIGSSGLDHWGHYRDDVQETPQGWRFRRRRISVEGWVVNSPIAAVVRPP